MKKKLVFYVAETPEQNKKVKMQIREMKIKRRTLRDGMGGCFIKRTRGDVNESYMQKTSHFFYFDKKYEQLATKFEEMGATIVFLGENQPLPIVKKKAVKTPVKQKPIKRK